MSLKRSLNLIELLNKKSFFLFGPRSTGKSTLIKTQLEDAIVFNLLKGTIFETLNEHTSAIEGMIDVELIRKKKKPFIVIDEIQKIPRLLDEVHRLIEERQLRFLLTGSSARKLKAEGVNLLGGRAWIANLFPLTFIEIPKFNFERFLQYGGLPSVYLSDFPEEELDAYVTTYINEEIKQEGLVRKIPAFMKFLKLASSTSGQLLNFSQLSSDIGVSAPTIRDYYTILEDTLLGTIVEPWQSEKNRKSVATAKFYFFDIGVLHRLKGIKNLERESDLFGTALEHFIFMELRAYLSYRRIKETLQFWRTQDQKFEVDFIISDNLAVEVKASQKLDPRKLKGLIEIQKEATFKHRVFVSLDEVDRVHQSGIMCLNWRSFLQRLWSDEWFK